MADPEPTPLEPSGRACPIACALGNRAVILALLLVAVVVVETLLRLNHPITNTDTPLVLARISKSMDPSLYPKSAPTAVDANYIPAYQEVVKFLAFGGSAWQGMMRLFVVTLALFLAGLWMVMREFRAGLAVTVLLVIAGSVIRDSGGGEYWGMSFQVEPIARYLFLALALLAIVPFVRTWPKISFKAGVTDLAIVGLLANLHPPSAVGWMLALAVMVLAAEGRWGRKVGAVLLGGALALVLALPAVLPSAVMASAAQSSLASMPFDELVRHIRQTQSEIFPWEVNPIYLGRALPQRQTLWIGAALYLGLMVAWFVAWLRTPAPERLSRKMWLRLAWIQWPFVIVTTRYQAVDLWFLVMAYFICIRREKETSRVEWLALALLASVNGVCWFGSAGLRAVWQLGEVRGMTFLVVNFSRVSRFIFLPLWMIAALWVRRHVARETVVPLLALFVAFLIPVDWWRNAAFLVLMFTGVFGTEWRAHWKGRLASSAVLGLLVGIAFADVCRRIALPPDWTVRGPLSLLVAALVFWLDVVLHTPRRWRPGAVAAGMSFALLLALGWRGIPEEARCAGRIAREFALSERQGPARELWAWARTETPKDSVFYAYDYREFSLFFAGMSQRSVVYSSKGGRAVATAAAPPGPEDSELRNVIEEPYRLSDTALLIARAAQFGADYAVLPPSMPEPPQSAPVVYENRLFRVIQIPR